MNIFVVDRDPAKAASYMCDKHVVKMVLETAQLLCTTVILRGGTAPYKPTHANHPCSVWARKTLGNYLWLCAHGQALCAEYTRRYSKVHKSESIIQQCKDSAYLLPGDGTSMTEHPQCMPVEYQQNDVVKAYRAFYLGDKKHFAKYKLGNYPEWWV